MDAVIKCFKDEFDRFWGYMEKQIEICPDELWNRKVGGWIFWHQVLHSIATVELFTGNQGQAGSGFSPEVILLSKEPDAQLSRTEMLQLAGRMKELADLYIADTTAENLTQAEPGMSQRFKREVTRQGVIIALIRHCSYHLGVCAAILRENGLPGVY